MVVVPALVREPVEAPPDEEEVEAELEDAPTPLHEVQWTVMQGESRDMLASRWGMMERTLVALNPELQGLDAVPAGLRLRVFEHDAEGNLPRARDRLRDFRFEYFGMGCVASRTIGGGATKVSGSAEMPSAQSLRTSSIVSGIVCAAVRSSGERY